MSNTIFNKALQVSKATNSILGKAGKKMIRSSFDTTKKIATLYKDAGYETYKIGKEVVKNSFKLAVDNQKEIMQTSGEAIKEAAKSIRETEAKASPKKVVKKRKTTKKRKIEVTVDDLL